METGRRPGPIEPSICFRLFAKIFYPNQHQGNGQHPQHRDAVAMDQILAEKQDLFHSFRIKANGQPGNDVIAIEGRQHLRCQLHGGHAEEHEQDINCNARQFQPAQRRENHKGKGLRKRLKSVFNERVLPNLEKMQYDFPVKYVDFFIIAFTSVSLSLADYAYQTKTPILIEETAKLLFNLLLQGPAKTFGLLQDEDA